MNNQTDWLGEEKIFFDQSSLMNERELLQSESLRLDPEGLGVFLEFGYAAFGKSLFTGVSQLLPNEKVVREPNGALKKVVLEDPMYSFSKIQSEEEILWTIRARINQHLDSSEKIVVLPLSGGLDSRILLWALRDQPRERIRAYSYGVSYPQRSSREAIVARDMAKKEGVRWELVPVGAFQKLQKEWIELMGVHQHAHGMLYLEFLKHIKSQIRPEKAVVLSGLLGDAFSGNHTVGPIRKASDISKLNLHHGRRIPRSLMGELALRSDQVKSRYFAMNSEHFLDPKSRLVELTRTKMNLLSYLVKIPRQLGFEALAPLTDKDVAMSMLNLPEDRRTGRIWQNEFLEKQKLNGISVTKRRGLSNISVDVQSYVLNSDLQFGPRILEGIVPDKLLEEVECEITFSPLEIAFALSKIGGSKKSAAIHLYKQIYPKLHALRYREMLHPIAVAAEKANSHRNPANDR